jgi:hypothetical protein
VLLAAAVLLAGVGYLAVPMIWISYMIFFGPGLACGNNCDQPPYTDVSESVFAIGAIAVYVLVMAFGVWWVMKGEPD